MAVYFLKELLIEFIIKKLSYKNYYMLVLLRITILY